MITTTDSLRDGLLTPEEAAALADWLNIPMHEVSVWELIDPPELVQQAKVKIYQARRQETESRREGKSFEPVRTDRLAPDDINPQVKEALGETGYEAYKAVLSHVRARWKGISFSDLKQELLIKAYGLKGQSGAYMYVALRNASIDFIRAEVREKARHVRAGLNFTDDSMDVTNQAVQDLVALKAGEMLEDKYVNPAYTRFTAYTDEATVSIDSVEVLKRMMITYLDDPAALTLHNCLVVEPLIKEMPAKVLESLHAYLDGDPDSKHKKRLTRYLEKIPSSKYE